MAVEAIRTGKARAVIAGGVEDICEEGSFEFGQMKATSSSVVESLAGREPDEQCRPSTSSRGGFMESEGAGVQLLMSADVALEMGLPIYAIVAGAFTATDREGRSVPAPGKGILSTARESHNNQGVSPLLDLKFRRQQFEDALQDLKAWRARQNTPLSDFTRREFDRRYRQLQSSFGSDFYVQDPSIAPLRGCLAAWGLTVSDLGVCSFHGTGTKANDRNESSVVDAQMRALGRCAGQPLFSIFQKYLTGHPKGAAAAWMTNGIIQCLRDQHIPGNRNADNVDKELAQFEHLVFTDRSLKVSSQNPLRAAYLHSFGFGQASAEVVIIHSDLLYAAITVSQQQHYERLRASREQKATRHLASALCDKKPLLFVKDSAPYADEDTEDVYLDPLWRVNSRADTQVPSTARESFKTEKDNLTEVLHLMPPAPSTSPSHPIGVGIDIEALHDFRDKDETFLERNFHDAEIQYINDEAVSRVASLTGRWCAKEAVIKAVSSLARPDVRVVGSSGDSLKDIEIVPTDNGAPQVRLHGEMETLAVSLKVRDIKVSISHTDAHAVAQAYVTVSSE